MKYKTDVQRRLSEILDELRINATYNPKEGFFTIIDSGFLIIEDELENHDDDNSNLNTDNLIRIFDDGTLRFINGSGVSIKYCKVCNKFSIGHKVKRDEDSCPYCKNSSLKYLFNNSKIPGWFGKEDESLIDQEEALKHFSNITSGQKSAIRNCINKLKGKISYITISPEKREKVIKLTEKYPNMKEVINYLVQSFDASSLRRHKEISFRPIVLVGGPGCGKTSFVTDLGIILLGQRAIKIDLGNDVESLTISGSDPTFKDSRHGLIIEAMFGTDEHGPIKNPLIHFDELDKINSNENHSIETVFYSILEKNTARSFFDNFIGINVDASGVNYIFTANTLKNIPAPIINRLRVFQIPDYTHDQLKEYVIDNFYQNWLNYNDMEREFLPEVLSDEIKEEILKECNDDTRNIEDSINLIFTKTMQTDNKTGHTIALFSPREYLAGWRYFCGKKNISKKSWELPEDFLRKSPETDTITKF